MSYNVEFAAEAEEDLARIAAIDPTLASYVLEQIDELAKRPTELSVRGGFPFRDH